MRPYWCWSRNAEVLRRLSHHIHRFLLIWSMPTVVLFVILSSSSPSKRLCSNISLSLIAFTSNVQNSAAVLHFPKIFLPVRHPTHLIELQLSHVIDAPHPAAPAPSRGSHGVQRLKHKATNNEAYEVGAN